MNINWFEFKYLDKSTNHSTQTEVIKYFDKKGVDITYHCSFKREAKYFGLSRKLIKYIEVPKVRFVRGVLILLTIFSRSFTLYCKNKSGVQIIDYMSLYTVLPVLLINKLYKRQTFILDIRTYPVSNTYEKLPFHFRLSHQIASYLCDGVSYITKVMQKDSLLWSRNKVENWTVWGSGYNPEVFRPKRESEVDAHSSTKLIYHGGISKSRGVLDLVKAVESCISEGFSVQLTLLGVWVDKEEIQGYIKSKGLDTHITCLDPLPIEEIPKYIEESDFGVLPFPDFIGWRVSSPIKLFEYLGMGKPVIVTDIECFTNEIGNTDYVIYAKNSSSQELARAIKSAITSKSTFKAEGISATPVIQENYTWEAQADKLLKFINKVTNNA